MAKTAMANATRDPKSILERVLIFLRKPIRLIKTSLLLYFGRMIWMRFWGSLIGVEPPFSPKIFSPQKKAPKEKKNLPQGDQREQKNIKKQFHKEWFAINLLFILFIFIVWKKTFKAIWICFQSLHICCKCYSKFALKI